MIESIVYVASLFAISDADAPHSIDALYRKSQCGKQAGGHGGKICTEHRTDSRCQMPVGVPVR